MSSFAMYAKQAPTLHKRVNDGLSETELLVISQVEPYKSSSKEMKRVESKT